MPIQDSLILAIAGRLRMVCFGVHGRRKRTFCEARATDAVLDDTWVALFRERFHKANIHLIMLSIEPLNSQMRWPTG